MLDEAEVIPQADVERHLMAQLAAHALSLPEDLQRIASLSDATDRQDELLESMLITVSAGQDKHELPPELEARVRLTYSDFTERLPSPPWQITRCTIRVAPVTLNVRDR